MPRTPELSYNLLLISGSLRARSVNAAILKTAHQLAPAEVTAHIFEAMSELPHFNPDDDREPLHAPVASLRNRIGKADVLLICKPEYAGACREPSRTCSIGWWAEWRWFANPVAWINVASVAAPNGGEDAHASLRKVMEYVDATIVETACARIPVSRRVVGEDGVIRDTDVRSQISAILDELVSFLRARIPPT